MTEVGFEKDIVVSSRIRLARNLSEVLFPIRIDTVEMGENVVRLVYNTINDYDEFELEMLSGLSKLDMLLLFEEHKISKELIENKDISAVCFDNKNNIVVMINEEDHIRMQCIKKGFRLDECFRKIKTIDNKLTALKIAKDNDLGYLTSHFSNLGTGMRASVMMFLPALTMAGAINNVIDNLSSLGLTMRGVFGEGSKAEGYLYQLSNQLSFGYTEEEIIEMVKSATKKLCEMENEARIVILEAKMESIKDVTYRAFGTLSNCYMLSLNETNKLISQLKFGKTLDLIDFKDENIIEDIELSSQPAHLEKRYGKQMTEKEEEKFRADYLQKRLKNQRI